jgi:hypothetical protein
LLSDCYRISLSEQDYSSRVRKLVLQTGVQPVRELRAQNLHLLTCRMKGV